MTTRHTEAINALRAMTLPYRGHCVHQHEGGKWWCCFCDAEVTPRLEAPPGHGPHVPSSDYVLQFAFGNEPCPARPTKAHRMERF